MGTGLAAPSFVAGFRQARRQRKQDERAERESRAGLRSRRLRDAATQLGIQSTRQAFDAQQVEQQRQAVIDRIQPAISAFAMSEGRTVTPLEQALNDYYPDGNDLELHRLEDGAFALSFNDGESRRIPGWKGVLEAVSVALSPDKFVENFQTRRDAKAKRRHERQLERLRALTDNAELVETPQGLVQVPGYVPGGGAAPRRLQLGNQPLRQAVGAGDQNIPADQANAERLIQGFQSVGVEISYPEAFAIVTQSSGNPRKAAREIYGSLLRWRAQQFPYPDSPERPTNEELIRMATEAMSFGERFGTKGITDYLPERRMQVPQTGTEQLSDEELLELYGG